ncbi:MAG TPA: hypothetical protein VFB06_19265 [Streptosporangiaceae bacterium]|nr:hypothetical protein [Streptosporangiaceae bacterium]
MPTQCQQCDTRGFACQDCVVTVIAPRGASRQLEEEEVRALNVLADAGMIPRLRLNVSRPRAPKLPSARRTWAFPSSKAS